MSLNSSTQIINSMAEVFRGPSWISDSNSQVAAWLLYLVSVPGTQLPSIASSQDSHSPFAFSLNTTSLPKAQVFNTCTLSFSSFKAFPTCDSFFKCPLLPGLPQQTPVSLCPCHPPLSLHIFRHNNQSDVFKPRPSQLCSCKWQFILVCDWRTFRCVYMEPVLCYLFL